MFRSSQLLAGVCALALTVLPGAVSAQPMTQFIGTAYGEYANIDAGFGSNGDYFGGGFGGHATLGSGFGVQGDVLFGTADFSGADADTWGIGGAITYRPMGADVRVGLGVSHTGLDVAGFDADLTFYGLGGEVYAGDMFTLVGRGGGWSGSGGGGSGDGFYIGGGGSLYPFPNLALSANVDYIDDSGGDVTDFGFQGEVLPFTAVPVTLYGGYNRTDVPGFDIDTWSIGLKVYLGQAGNNELVDFHRGQQIRVAPRIRVLQ